jgi:hypothetical protein
MRICLRTLKTPETLALAVEKPRFCQFAQTSYANLVFLSICRPIDFPTLPQSLFHLTLPCLPSMDELVIKTSKFSEETRVAAFD